jgi:hypothetical protein
MADGHMGAPEFKISGDVTVGFFDIGGKTSFGGNDSELNFNASQKDGGLTYFGSMTAMVDDSIDGKNIYSDDMYVGFKGAFGEVRMGDTDNGCDSVDTGWVADDNFISHESGGCKAGDQNNITYRGSRGPVSYAVGYSPDVDAGSTNAGEDTVSVGIKGKVGPAAVSLGYESETKNGSNVVLGVSGNFGPVAVGIRANKFENVDTNGEDTYVGYTAQYSAGANKMYVGYGDIGDDMNTLFLGYNRSIGSNTTFIAEYVNVDGATDDKYAVALKHAF